MVLELAVIQQVGDSELEGKAKGRLDERREVEVNQDRGVRFENLHDAQAPARAASSLGGSVSYSPTRVSGPPCQRPRVAHAAATGQEARKLGASGHFRVDFRALNLTETLREPEGKTLEFKRDLSSPERFLRTVVAFANTSGGTILVGIEDRSRHIRGVAEPLALEERAVNLISDSIRPRLMPDLEIVSYRNRQLLAVRVYPSSTRPHYIARTGPDAGTYVRVGSTNRRADAQLIAEMHDSPRESHSTNGRCRHSTRKPSTSESLPSSFPP